MTKETVIKLTIEELLNRWPQTAELFHDYQMACVGCVMAPFYSVLDAISIYNLDEEPFLDDLMQVIEKGERLEIKE